MSTRGALQLLGLLAGAGVAVYSLARVGAGYSAMVVVIFTLAGLWEFGYARTHRSLSGAGVLLGWCLAALLGFGVLAGLR